ncbi:FAD-dependent oxidoreductase [Dickeya chrysanthemi]|uniref:NAD(P)/FAD-dependent oxidoreductase n=1 Tax=Dickeya chrysanthemi TaxID=556 RepID=UPI003019B37A
MESSRDTLWDIVIIGAGLAGSALAANVSQPGRRTLVLEATTPGSGGASAHSRGIVRVYDPNPSLMRKNVGGVQEWRRLNQRWPGVFTSCGVLYLLKDAHRETALPMIEAFSSPDYPIELISAQQAMQLLPGLSIPPQTSVIWEPGGGYVNPRLACQLLIEQARRQGAEILEGTTVSAVEPGRNGVRVRAGGVTVRTRLAVIAAGAYSSELAPVRGLFSRSIPLSSLYSPSVQAPGVCLIDEDSGSYLRPNSAAFVFAGGSTQHDAPFVHQLSWLPERHQMNQQLAQQRLPGTELCLVDGRDGYDGYTPDFIPEISVMPDAGLALFCGFSGRGAKYIPDAARQFSEQLQAMLS